MKKIDKKILKNLSPFRDLSADKINEIVNKAKIEELPATRVLFRQGDHDKRTYFLLAGQIELTTPGKSRPTVIKAKTAMATNAIEQILPRLSTARTKTASTLLSIDTDLLDILIADDSVVASYVVTELDVNETEDESDWMLLFLQSKAFLNLPTENIQNLLMKMTEVEYKKGDVVVKQGSQDDYYYIIKSGQCNVSRRPAPKVKDVKLAILTVGDGFGEEALITNGKRNATVTMDEDGALMRLTKDDFNSILVQPLLEYIDEETASKLVQSGARLIDVRGKNEFKADAIEGAINIPLSMLRNRATSLNPSRKYVVYCDSGNRSAAAAFLMCQLGFHCSIIQSGMTSCDTLLRPKETDLSSLRALTQSSATAESESYSVTVSTPQLEPSPITTTKAAKLANANDLQIPILNDDEINLIKSKAEQEFSSKLQLERQVAINKAAEIEKKYQDRLLQERKKLAIAENHSKKEQSKIEQNYQEKLSLERSRASQAENEIQKAQNEIELIKKEALTIREHSQLELDRYKNEIETERKRVESELKQSQKDAVKRQKVEKIIIEKQEKAEAEVQIAKEQISNIKSEAEQEIESLRAELLHRKKEQTALEHKRLEAEEKSLRANKLLEAAKQEASAEIDNIRTQVLQEKTELEKAIKKHREETDLQLQKNTEEALQSQRDAEKAVIKLRTELAAKDQQNRKLEQQENMAKEQADKLSLDAEEARLTAEMEAAHFRAEAESIREQAKSEAHKLKNEIDASRRLMEEQAKITQAEAEQARLIRQQVEEDKRLIAQDIITKKAKQEVDDAHKKIELEFEQAKQLARETELARRAKAEAEAFEQTRLETELLARRNAEEAAIRAEQRAIQLEKEHAEEQEKQLAQLRTQERANAITRKAQELSKQRAAKIAATLKKKAQPVVDPELNSDISSDISLAKSTIVEKNGKLILEGENDVFVFQRPEPEDIVFEELDDDENDIPVLNAVDQIPDLGEENIVDSSDDLFDFEELNNSNDRIFTEQTNIVSPDQFTQIDTSKKTFNPTDSVALSSNTFLQTNSVSNAKAYRSPHLSNNRKLPRNKTLTLIATTTVVIIVIGIFSATNDTYFNVDKVLAWLEPNQQVIVEETETRRLSRIAAAQSRAELNVKENAASEFKTMLEKWKDSVELGPDQ